MFVCLAYILLAYGEARAQEWQWAKMPGMLRSTYEGTKQSQTDKNGCLYVTGNFRDTLSWDIGITLPTQKDAFDVFIAKYSPCGNVLWIKQIINKSQDYYTEPSLHIDNQNNLFLYCTLSNNASIQGINLNTTNSTSRCLIKFNPDGSYLWHTLYPKSAIVQSYIFSDNEGNVYMYGNMNEATSFGGTLYPLQGSSTIFLTKQNSSGQFQEVKFFPCLQKNIAGYAEIGTSGDIYITGHFKGSIDIGSTTLQSSPNTRSLFLAVLKKNGQNWAKKIDVGASHLSENISSLMVKESDNAIYMGGYNLNITIDQPLYINYSVDSTFLLKYNLLGELLWKKRGMNKIANSIVSDNQSNIYVLQDVFSTTFYDWVPSDGSFYRGIDIVKYDKNGNQNLTKSVGNNVIASKASELSFDNNGSIYMVGRAWFVLPGSMTFGNTSFTKPIISPNPPWWLFCAKLFTGLITAGSNLSLCSDTQGQLGSPPLPNYGYSWTPTEGLSNPNIANPTVSLENNTDAPIVKQYIVKASDMTCPNAPLNKYDTVKVTVLPAYNDLKIFTGSPVVCPNTSGTKYWINAKPNYDFAWSVSGGTIESGQGTDTIRVAWQNPNTNAWVEVKAKHKIYGCETSFKLPIVVDNLLKPDKPVGESAFCIEPEKVFAYKTSLLNNGSTYLWKTDDNTAIWVGANNQSEVKIRWTTTGIKKLWVVETNQTPCVGSSEMLEINVLPTPTPIDIRGATSIPFFASQVRYEVQASTGATYQWTLAQGGKITEGQGSPAIRIDWEQEGEYLLTVQETNSSGCVGKPAEMHIKVVPFLPPNVITPNGDGKNDTWFLAYIENFPAHKVQIFDRAGKLVHQSTAYKNDWDASGLPADVYFYYLTLHPNIKPFKGAITVIR